MMSETVISRAVKAFEESLRIMDRDKSPQHAFDLGADPNGVMFSVLILIAPKESIDRLGPVPSKPLGETA